MMLVNEGKIISDKDEMVEANHANVAPNQKKFLRSSSITIPPSCDSEVYCLLKLMFQGKLLRIH